MSDLTLSIATAVLVATGTGVDMTLSCNVLGGSYSSMDNLFQLQCFTHKSLLFFPRGPSPVNDHCLDFFLKSHLDQCFASSILSGFCEGFRIGFSDAHISR